MSTQTLLTADEYAETREDGLSELVRGRVLSLPFPNARHGVTRGSVQFALRWVERHRPDGPSRRFENDERISDSPALPGFSVADA